MKNRDFCGKMKSLDLFVTFVMLTFLRHTRLPKSKSRAPRTHGDATMCFGLFGLFKTLPCEVSVNSNIAIREKCHVFSPRFMTVFFYVSV